METSAEMFYSLEHKCFSLVDSGMIFSAGDITAPLRRGHRRALCVDG